MDACDTVVSLLLVFPDVHISCLLCGIGYSPFHSMGFQEPALQQHAMHRRDQPNMNVFTVPPERKTEKGNFDNPVLNWKVMLLCKLFI